MAKTSQVMFKVEDDRKERWYEQAERDGMTPSDWFRTLADQRVAEHAAPLPRPPRRTFRPEASRG